MYSHSYILPDNNMYRTNNNVSYNEFSNQAYPYMNEDERFLLAPLLVGGLAGTALGYGIANNNQLNNGNCCTTYYPPMYQPIYPVGYPISTSNNYYY